MEVCVDSFESALAAIQGGAQRIELCSSLEQGGLTPSLGLLRLIRRRLSSELIIFIMIRCRPGDFIYDDNDLTAVQGGAQRIELCSSLEQGGLTPSLGLLRLIRRRLSSELIIFIMIRCRPGDFIYDDNDLSVMEEEIRLFIESNQQINGFVLGTLNSDGTIDINSLKRLIQLIPKDISLTFHRAFDFISKWEIGIDQLIELGFQRILTSGQEANAYYGRKCIRQMINYSQNRIIILPGCGINVTNLEAILRETGAKEFHASARIPNYHNDSIEGNLFDETVEEEQRLSSQEATKILQTHEASIDLEANCPVNYYEVNYLGANNPSGMLI
ncbi:unnamed protein product [Rotaria sp. Silwood1]|nr:unnamed protein product [Rotaria sp. Silwood1]